MQSGIAIILGSYLSFFALSQALAAAPLASPEQDRYAKQAIPPSGKALIYVYRLNDGNPKAMPELWLNKRASGNLEPRTYGMWAAGPGRLEVRAGRADATPLTFNCEAGRIYFIQLSVREDGSTALRKESYGNGRNDLRQARLVLDPVLAARAAAVPPPVPAREAVTAKAAPVEKPVVKATQQVSDVPAKEGISGFTFIAKLGSFQLANESQVIVLNTRNFSAASMAYGLEGEWRLKNGIAFGIELFGYTHDYTTTGLAESGDMAVTNVFFNVKNYFRPGALVQPYIGVGIGSAVATFSAGSGSSINDGASAGGFAVQGLAGVAFRWRHFGIYTELKVERAEIEDSAGQSVDVSGTGLFAGMSVHF